MSGYPTAGDFTIRQSYTVNALTGPMRIGQGGASASQYFNGEIDEVHMWTNRLLDATEVSIIYTTELAGNSILP